MKSKLILLILILLTSGCIASYEIELESNKYEVLSPINTIRISDNFYVDQTEISNIDYREYQYYLKFVHGENSKILQESLLDTTVCNSIKKLETASDVYFVHPMYDYYPVIGITLDQAKKYSEWRTEVITEMELISLGLIKLNKHRTPENYFTIERYLEGEMDWIIK